MTWDKQVPGCFGNSDLIFAGHPADEDRAFEWLCDLRLRGIGCSAALAQIASYLTTKTANADHIKSQLTQAEAKLCPWLLD